MKRYDVIVAAGTDLEPDLGLSWRGGVARALCDLAEVDARWWIDLLERTHGVTAESRPSGESVALLEPASAARRGNRFPSELSWRHDELTEVRGSDTQTTRTRHEDASGAREAYERRLRQLEGAGYQVFDDLAALYGALAARSPTLDQALVENPYDRDTLAVYSDWLTQQGDARGALIARSLAGDDIVRSAILRGHRRHLFGPLAWRDQDAGFLLGWRDGFICSAHLRQQAQLDARLALRALFALPAALLLEEVSCADGMQQILMDALVALEPPPRLARVVVGPRHDARTFGTVSTPPAALGRYREVHLGGGYFIVEALPLEQTRHLVIFGRFDAALLRLLARSLPARVDTLELRYTSYDPAGRPALEAFLRSERVARQIEHLTLRATRQPPAVSNNASTFCAHAVGSLLAGALPKRLRTLALGDEINVANARKLVGARARLGALEALELTGRPRHCTPLREATAPLGAAGIVVSVHEAVVLA